MRVLVLGASGATGILVARQLMRRQIYIRVVLRTGAFFPSELQESPLVETVRGNINEFTDSEMNELLRDCDAAVCCLGHNITFKGILGNPRNLVFDAIKSVSETVRRVANRKVKIVLMSTTAYTNTSVGETNSIGEKIVLSILGVLLPPHRDNVNAANYMINEIGTDDATIEWIAVRPDTLINDDDQSPYQIHKSSIRSPVFNAGKVSRINVSHFITELLTSDRLWQEWKFKTPVIYNR